MNNYLPRELLKWFYDNHKIAKDKDGNKLPYKVFYSRFYNKYKRETDSSFISEIEQRLRIICKGREKILRSINEMLNV